MTNMERFELSKQYWSDAFNPQSRVEGRLMTLIAFQDLLFERSMTVALSSPDPRKAASAERRQNDLILSIERLVQITATLQHRRLEASVPPTLPTNVIEMPKRTNAPAGRPTPVAQLDVDAAPSLHPFGSARSVEPRKRSARTALDLRNAPAA
jgi:hypothetical protein